MRGFFLTGTDTGVGKTVTAAALLHRLRSTRPTRYWKPIQTGIEQDDDTATVLRLTGCDAGAVLDRGVRLAHPLSPHLSARLRGIRITVDQVVDMAASELDGGNWIVEGAGGLLVPINEQELMADLIARLALPVVVVARSTLGTINHTLLTLEALRARSLPIAGVVMVGRNVENRQAIEDYGRIPVSELPILTPLTPATLQAAAADFDAGALL
jgi:dethiobiotin synthetase